MQRLVATTALIPVALAQATYYGCYVDPPARALTGALMVDYENMTISVCEEFCTTGANSFPIWGIEYGGECYCGSSLAVGSFPSFETDCQMACPGNTEVVCGGPSRLSLYGQSATAPAHTPVPVNEEVTHYVSQGCWTEAIGVRTLNGASVVSSLMTIDSCGNFCLNNGFLYFGLEYGSECWCGNMINDQSVIGEEEGAMSVLESECNMPCAGNSEEDCGAGNRLSVYRWVSDEESE